MKLSRLTIPYTGLKNLSYIFFVLIFSGSFSLREPNIGSLTIISVTVGALMALSFLWSYLTWKNYSYWIDEDTLRIKQGVLRKQNRRIPKKRIQNVDIKRNIVQRALGISQVKLETAGGGETEATLSYLEFEDAQRLRRQLRQREKQEGSIENENDEPIYKISDKELALLSLTSIDLRQALGIIVLFGIVPSFFGGYLEEAEISLMVGTSIILVTLTILTFFSSIVSTFLQYWGFKLYKKENSLEYERGLLNRSEGSIPLNKIQRVTMEENVLKRMIGYSSLKIDTAGYSPGESMEKGSEAAIPMAKKQKSMNLANDIAGIKKIELESIGESAKLRYTARYLIVSTLIIAALFQTDTGVKLEIISVLSLAGVSVIAARLKWSNKGFAAGKNHCVTLNGFWNRSTNFIPYFRVQNLIETQSILQKRLELASVDIDTAGTGNLLNKTVAVDLEKKQAEKFREEVFQKFKQSLK